MSSPPDHHGDLIQQFCQLTQADPDQARQFLDASKWDLLTAVNHYFEGAGVEGDEEDEDLDYDDEEPELSPRPRDAENTQPQAKGPPGKPRGPVTLGDLSRRSEPDDGGEDQEEERNQNYFAGGEKSGLAIKNPADRKGTIEDMLRKAVRDHGRREEDEPGPSRPTGPRFSGVGHTLGSEDTPSISVPDPSTHQRPETELEVVRRDLTFWRDGMSVGDGPLLRYDDPANSAILSSIQQGRAPADLMNVGFGQRADVHVHKRLDEDYVPPKTKRQPFSGTGMRLGSPTPGVVPSSSSPAAVSTPAPAAAVAPSSLPSGGPKPAPSVSVDSSAPATTVRVRLGDGTSLVSRFNHTHTVGDLYGFVNAASLDSRRRNYVLQTTFPSKELRDHDLSLKDAGLLNANVVQKWV